MICSINSDQLDKITDELAKELNIDSNDVFYPILHERIDIYSSFEEAYHKIHNIESNINNSISSSILDSNPDNFNILQQWIKSTPGIIDIDDFIAYIKPSFYINANTIILSNENLSYILHDISDRLKFDSCQEFFKMDANQNIINEDSSEVDGKLVYYLISVSMREYRLIVKENDGNTDNTTIKGCLEFASKIISEIADTGNFSSIYNNNLFEIKACFEDKDINLKY